MPDKAQSVNVQAKWLVESADTCQCRDVSTLAERLTKAIRATGAKKDALELAAGLGSGTVSRWSRGERGAKRVDQENVRKLATELRVPFEWLYAGFGPDPFDGDTSPPRSVDHAHPRNAVIDRVGELDGADRRDIDAAQDFRGRSGTADLSEAQARELIASMRFARRSLEKPPPAPKREKATPTNASMRRGPKR